MSVKESKSKKLFAEALQYIPGGVNSPVRACKAVESDPIFIQSASGSKITSVDNETYIDFVESWGPMLLGHADPDVGKAIHNAVDRGTSYGASCEGEVLLAKEICDAFPAMDMVRMVNSGTEATMSALRLARAVTGRNKVVKFIGCYHGHADPFLASAGSGLATLSIPGTPGVPEAVVQDTLLAPYNNLQAVKDIFVLYGKQIAAIIVEPVAANMGLVIPSDNFLKGLRTICDNFGALLIFDEVITGFRAEYGGAQTRFNITPDITTLGKIIGGGLPVGAYGGKKEYMQNISPSGDVYQAGTLSGNPLAMAAGLATLKKLKNSDYKSLEQRVKVFCEELQAILATKAEVKIITFASMFTIYFSNLASEEIKDFESVKQSDNAKYISFYKQMRANRVSFAPSAFEVAMTSFTHSADDFSTVLELAKKIKL